jgi:Photosynthesis system II assembly factor YCF48
MKSDRDQSIERLLRALPRPGDGTSPDGSCPDPETLAALADDTLLPAVRREIENHVADCDRCQMVTATLVRAEGVRAEAAADARTWKRRVVNWLVPAAAAATAVALWVVVPGQRTPAPEEAVSDQIAVAPSAPAAEAPTGPRLQTPIDALKDQSAAAAPEARADRAVPSEAAQPSPNDLSRRQGVGQPDLKAEEYRSREAESGGPPREAAPATVAGDLQVSGQSARNDAGRRETIQETVTVEEPGRSAPTPPAASAAGFQGRVAASVEIVSSNAQVHWRIGPGTVVQRSADGGMTWVSQQTGATADLTAGSSPSTDVCWLVGRGGLVLRTTDGGRQWQRVPFAETVDITAVTASDALNAVVSLADGRRLQTTDGGRTWVRLP